MILSAISNNGWAEIKVIKIGDSLVDGGALTIQGGFGQALNGLSFRQDAMATHGVYPYVEFAEYAWAGGVFPGTGACGDVARYGRK